MKREVHIPSKIEMTTYSVMKEASTQLLKERILCPDLGFLESVEVTYCRENDSWIRAVLPDFHTHPYLTVEHTDFGNLQSHSFI